MLLKKVLLTQKMRLAALGAYLDSVGDTMGRAHFVPNNNQLVIAIVGRRGSGKTLLLTELLRDAFEHKRKVIANYHLRFPYTYLRLEDVAKLPESIHDAALGLDELHMAADSRDFTRKSNRNLSTLFTQMRKRRCTVYYTTQFQSQIDKRIRQHTDVLIHCEPTDVPGVIRATVHDAPALMFSHVRDTILNRFVFDGRGIFDLYDTNEVITWEDDEDDEDTDA